MRVCPEEALEAVAAVLLCLYSTGVLGLLFAVSGASVKVNPAYDDDDDHHHQSAPGKHDRLQDSDYFCNQQAFGLSLLTLPYAPCRFFHSLDHRTATIQGHWLVLALASRIEPALASVWPFFSQHSALASGPWWSWDLVSAGEAWW